MSRTKRTIPPGWDKEFAARIESGVYSDIHRRMTKPVERNQFLNGRDNKWSAYKDRDTREMVETLNHKRKRIVKREMKVDLEG